MPYQQRTFLSYFLTWMVCLLWSTSIYAQTDQESKRVEEFFLLVQSVAKQESGTLHDVEKFLEEGVNPNILFAQNEHNETWLAPLHIATISLNLDLVRLLLKYGANPTLESHPHRRSGYVKMTPVWIIARRLSPLIEEGNTTSREYNENYEALKVLLKYANLRVQNPIDPLLKMDILTWATYLGLPEIVALALKAGANPQRQISLMGIAFEEASSLYPKDAKKYLDVIRILVEYEVDVFFQNSFGSNLLHLSAHFGDERLSRQLLEAGVPALKFNVFGITPALMAFQREHLILALFLKNAEMRACSKYVM